MFIIHGWTPLFFPVVHSVGQRVYQIKGVSNKMIFHFCFVSFVCFDSFHLIAAGVCVCVFVSARVPVCVCARTCVGVCMRACIYVCCFLLFFWRG